MTHRPARTRSTLLRRLVLWLLVAAVPWHVAAAVAMTLTAVPAHPPAAAITMQAGAVVEAAPCHDTAAAHPDAGCATCASCCALAAPPMAVAGVEPTEAAGEAAVAGVQPAAVFLTDGPLRPPRSPRS